MPNSDMAAGQARGFPLPGGRYGYIDVAAIPGVTPELVSMPPMPAWTQRDEEELRTVRATLAELEARRELAISKIKGVANMAFESGMTRDEYVAWLIVNADEIRDTLAPFDSGVREA